MEDSAEEHLEASNAPATANSKVNAIKETDTTPPMPQEVSTTSLFQWTWIEPALPLSEEDAVEDIITLADGPPMLVQTPSHDGPLMPALPATNVER